MGVGVLLSCHEDNTDQLLSFSIIHIIKIKSPSVGGVSGVYAHYCLKDRRHG